MPNHAGSPPRFREERRGLLDYGQMYAGKSGSTFKQSGESRRVLFAFAGWNEPTHTAACGRCMLLPRELSLSPGGVLLQHPVSDVNRCWVTLRARLVVLTGAG